MNSKIYVVTGHYGSGKTEFSVNFALRLKKTHKKVFLVDLDIVNPYFRSNDARTLLEEAGITVLAPKYAGTNVDIPVLPPEIMRIFEEQDARIVLDVGGDDDGAVALGRYKQFFDRSNYEMLLVTNARRPLTTTPEEIIEMKTNIEAASRLSVTHLVSCTNLADETTKEVIEEGYAVTKQVSLLTGLPIKFVCAEEKPAQEVTGEAKEKLFLISRKLLKL